MLIGYFATLAEADRSVLFDPPNPARPDVREAAGWCGGLKSIRGVT